jgi:hypothetical protein
MLIVAVSVVELTYSVDVTVIVVSTTPLRSHAAFELRREASDP